MRTRRSGMYRSKVEVLQDEDDESIIMSKRTEDAAHHQPQMNTSKRKSEAIVKKVIESGCETMEEHWENKKNTHKNRDFSQSTPKKKKKKTSCNKCSNDDNGKEERGREQDEYVINTVNKVVQKVVNEALRPYVIEQRDDVDMFESTSAYLSSILCGMRGRKRSSRVVIDRYGRGCRDSKLNHYGCDHGYGINQDDNKASALLLLQMSQFAKAGVDMTISVREEREECSNISL